MKSMKKIMVYVLTLILLTNLMYLFWGGTFNLTFSKPEYRNYYFEFNVYSSIVIVFLLPLLSIKRKDNIWHKILKSTFAIVSPALAFGIYLGISFDACNFWQYNFYRIIEYKNKNNSSYIAKIEYNCPAPGGLSFEKHVKILPLNKYFDYIIPVDTSTIDRNWIKINNYKIVGVILDEDTKKPIERAFLKTEQKNKEKLYSERQSCTASDGSFMIFLFETDKQSEMHILSVRKEGYLSHKIVISDLTKTHTIKLDTVYLSPIR